tara:strand:+ start:35 stop:352 length:318 start_codon:yes stop_codon:yes gene_type:complete
MNLTTRQKEIYEKIQSVDSDWNEESFAIAWNDILKLNKFISISNGKLILEFDDPNTVTIKFERDKKNILEEKIFWNEFIQLDEKKDETKEIANTIKNLAERIMVS